MANVYKVYGQVEYEIEIVASDAGDAEELAYQMALSKWDTDHKLFVTAIEKVSSDANEWFGPDRNDEY